MNKEEIVEELNKYVKSIDKWFSVTSDDDLNLKIRNDYLFVIKNWNKNAIFMCGNELKNTRKIIKTDIINKFYKKAVELMDKLNEKKYTIQVFKAKGGFLYWNPMYACYQVGYLNNDVFKYEFKQEEIEVLKHRQDIAIDWDKAIIKEVKSDE